MSPEVRRWVRALCEPGRHVIDPSPAQRAAIRAIAQGPGVAIQDRVFACFDPSVDGHRDQRGCTAWIALEADADEYVCPACGREHEAFHGHREAERVRIALPHDRVEGWIATQLAASSLGATPLSGGASWRVEEVIVVWLDRGEGSRWTSRGAIATNPTVFVLANRALWSARLPVGPGLVVLELGDWLADGPQALHDALSGAAPAGLVHDAALPAWSSVRAPAPTTVVRRAGAPELVVRDDGASVDGVDVLQASSTMLDVLRLLCARWTQDLVAKTPPDAFRTLTTDELRKHLGSTDGAIRQALSRLRDTLRERLQATWLEDPGADAIVENVPGRGYRVRPNVFVRMACDTPAKVRTPPTNVRTPRSSANG